MLITTIKTRIFTPPKDSLDDLLGYITDLKERDIVVVTSKVVSICQGRCVPKEGSKISELMENEARPNSRMFSKMGIDESNGNKHWILHPIEPDKAAEEICCLLRSKFSIVELGVIITDTMYFHPRSALISVALGWHGIEPRKSYIGVSDLFGFVFTYELFTIVDSLAAGACIEMGEGNECKPLAIIRDFAPASFIKPKRRMSDGGQSSA